MGKKKDKEKVKAKDVVRPGRKDLESEIVTLRQQNASLKARLDTIAEIAGANPDGSGDVNFQLDKQKS